MVEMVALAEMVLVEMEGMVLVEMEVRMRMPNQTGPSSKCLEGRLAALTTVLQWPQS